MVLSLNLTKEEAFALLTLALSSAVEDDETSEMALRKLVTLCRSYLSEEIESKNCVPA